MKIILITLAILLLIYLFFKIRRIILINQIKNSNDYGLLFLIQVVPEIKNGVNVKEAIKNGLVGFDDDLKKKLN